MNLSEHKEHLTIDKRGNITGSNGALLFLWMQQKEMGLEVIGQIPLCG
jgi:hypothetical protein